MSNSVGQTESFARNHKPHILARGHRVMPDQIERVRELPRSPAECSRERFGADCASLVARAAERLIERGVLWADDHHMIHKVPDDAHH